MELTCVIGISFGMARVIGTDMGIMIWFGIHMDYWVLWFGYVWGYGLGLGFRKVGSDPTKGILSLLTVVLYTYFIHICYYYGVSIIVHR